MAFVYTMIPYSKIPNVFVFICPVGLMQVSYTYLYNDDIWIHGAFHYHIIIIYSHMYRSSWFRQFVYIVMHQYTTIMPGSICSLKNTWDGKFPFVLHFPTRISKTIYLYYMSPLGYAVIISFYIYPYLYSSDLRDYNMYVVYEGKLYLGTYQKPIHNQKLALVLFALWLCIRITHM